MSCLLMSMLLLLLFGARDQISIQQHWLLCCCQGGSPSTPLSHEVVDGSVLTPLVKKLLHRQDRGRYCTAA